MGGRGASSSKGGGGRSSKSGKISIAEVSAAVKGRSTYKGVISRIDKKIMLEQGRMITAQGPNKNALIDKAAKKIDKYYDKRAEAVYKMNEFQKIIDNYQKQNGR